MFGLFKKRQENPPAPAQTPPPPLPTKQSPQQGEQGFHANQALIPETELEQMLVDGKQGKVGLEEAMNFFLNSEVGILDTDFDPAQPNKLHNPFYQYGPNNELLLALFSSSNRANPHRERRPEFHYLKTMAVVSLIRALAPGIGLVLNPGWKVGLQVPREEIARIKSYLK